MRLTSFFVGGRSSREKRERGFSNKGKKSRDEKLNLRSDREVFVNLKVGDIYLAMEAYKEFTVWKHTFLYT